MSAELVFVDTNVIIYTFDVSDPKKTELARKLLKQVRQDGSGCVSAQVIAEFCNVALRHAKVQLKMDDVQRVLGELMVPMLKHTVDAAFYRRVIGIYAKYSLSFYDAAVVQAAIDLKCKVLYSEDMQDGAVYDGVRVVNPFL